MITHFAALELSTVSIEGVKQIYADGNVLEIIAFDGGRDDDAERILPPVEPLWVMYLREVGVPTSDVGKLRAWLTERLGMKSAYGSDTFDFVYSGTAYPVTVSLDRPWIPIDMAALPPRHAGRLWHAGPRVFSPDRVGSGLERDGWGSPSPARPGGLVSIRKL